MSLDLNDRNTKFSKYKPNPASKLHPYLTIHLAYLSITDNIFSNRKLSNPSRFCSTSAPSRLARPFSVIPVFQNTGFSVTGGY